MTASMPSTKEEAAVEIAPAALPLTSGQPASPTAPARSGEEWRRLRRWMVAHITSGIEGVLEQGRTADTLDLLAQRFEGLFRQAQVQLSADDRKHLLDEVVDEIVGYGPIERLLRDETISEIMVNAADQVYVERNGLLTLSDVCFDNSEHIMWLIDRIIRPLGRRADRTTPMVDARLPDGSRVNAIIPPGAIDGPTITVRKFGKKKLTMEDLINYGSLTTNMGRFLQACVVSRLNIVVAGGTGSGKTTLLNILSGFIPDGERIVTVEDSAELQLQQPHVVRLEGQPPDLDGTGEVTIRSLVRNALRMRPDRIVVGECRGGEALDMLQAMNTGHDGSMTTAHANSPRDTLARLETMTLMAGFDLPVVVIRQQVAAAIDLIVQQARLRDGSRKITNVTEIQGMEGDVVILEDIFRYEEGGLGTDGQVQGELKPTGIRPRCDARLQRAGFQFPPQTFMSEATLNDWPGRGRQR